MRAARSVWDRLMTSLVIGADVGGSSTRMSVADLSGAIVSTVRAAAGNPNAVGVDHAAMVIATATREVLAEVDGQVVAMVVGMAGGSRPAVDASFLAAIGPQGVTPRVVSDLAVAFSSATPAREGYVLVAGTGAVAGHVIDDVVVDQRDGWGWLLGDGGAGFWLGREAVRSTLRVLEAGRPLHPLHRDVLLAAEATDRAGLVHACYERPPIWLASFAPLIARHADDPPATSIAAEAAEQLAQLVVDLRPDPDLPVIVAGSVATAPGPVATLLADQLRVRLSNSVQRARSGLVGALWSALRSAGVDELSVHRRLVTTLG